VTSVYDNILQIKESSMSKQELDMGFTYISHSGQAIKKIVDAKKKFKDVKDFFTWTENTLIKVNDNMGSNTKLTTFDQTKTYHFISHDPDLTTELIKNSSSYLTDQLNSEIIDTHLQEAWDIRNKNEEPLTQPAVLAARLYTCETPRIYFIVNDLLRKLAEENTSEKSICST